MVEPCRTTLHLSLWGTGWSIRLRPHTYQSSRLGHHRLHFPAPFRPPLRMSYRDPRYELHNIHAPLISYRSFGRLHSTSLALLFPRLVLQLPPVAPMFSLTHSFEPPSLSLCQHQTALQVSHLTYARYNHKRFNDNYHTTAVGMELTTRLVAIDYYRRYKVQGA